jgi:glycerophosphoryl diester phosphodiesterase
MDINTKEKAEFAFNFAKTNNIDLDLFYGRVTKEFINLCKENNIKVNVWTVDDPNKALELIENGVDFITSNILE